MEIDVELHLLMLTVLTLPVSNVNVQDNITDFLRPKWFYCFGDYCNTDTQEEYCSETFKMCRPCTDVLDDCFTPLIPKNCSSTCKEHAMEQAQGKPCEKLKELTHGEHNGSRIDPHKVGEVIKFTCKERYRLVGTDYIECKGCGHWSNSVPTCEEVVCPILHIVANGKHNGSSQHSTPGDVVVTSCAYGHQLHGRNKTVCNSSGFWTNPLPVCEPMACTRPHPIRNGGWLSSHQSTGQYIPGDTLNAECEQDYLMDGSAVWNCSNEGYWTSNNSFWPNCLIHGELSERCTSCIGTSICLGILLFLSIGMNIFQYCRQKSANRNHHEPEFCQKGKVNYKKGMVIFEDETKMLVGTNKEKELEETVSLDQSRKAKEKVVLGGTYDMPKPNIVNNQSKDSSDPSNNTHIHQGLTTNVTVTVYNNNENTNNSSDANQQATPNTTATTDYDKRENSDAAPPKPSENDKAPVEESGVSSQPSEPEPLCDTSPSKPEFGGTVPVVTSRIPTRDYELNVNEEQNAAAPVQQTINNEQDIGQKVVLPNNEINTDDINA